MLWLHRAQTKKKTNVEIRSEGQNAGNGKLSKCYSKTQKLGCIFSYTKQKRKIDSMCLLIINVILFLSKIET